jgi:hypothetical protein
MVSLYYYEQVVHDVSPKSGLFLVEALFPYELLLNSSAHSEGHGVA